MCFAQGTPGSCGKACGYGTLCRSSQRRNGAGRESEAYTMERLKPGAGRRNGAVPLHYDLSSPNGEGPPQQWGRPSEKLHFSMLPLYHKWDRNAMQMERMFDNSRPRQPQGMAFYAGLDGLCGCGRHAPPGSLERPENRTRRRVKPGGERPFVISHYNRTRQG